MPRSGKLLEPNDLRSGSNVSKPAGSKTTAPKTKILERIHFDPSHASVTHGHPYRDQSRQVQKHQVSCGLFRQLHGADRGCYTSSQGHWSHENEEVIHPHTMSLCDIRLGPRTRPPGRVFAWANK